jgi:hypothetical protein
VRHVGARFSRDATAADEARTERERTGKRRELRSRVGRGVEVERTGRGEGGNANRYQSKAAAFSPANIPVSATCIVFISFFNTFSPSSLILEREMFMLEVIFLNFTFLNTLFLGRW